MSNETERERDLRARYDSRAQVRELAEGAHLGNGLELGWTVGIQGDAWPVVWTHGAPAQFVPYMEHHFQKIAPHEMRFQMPAQFRQDICGATTTAGGRCKNKPGKCRYHSKREGGEA